MRHFKLKLLAVLVLAIAFNAGKSIADPAPATACTKEQRS